MAIQKRPLQDPQPDALGRILLWFRHLVDQLLMILDLQTLDDSIETRLKRLRHIYYNDSKVNVSYRRVRDVLRGHVDTDHYGFYDRLLSAERIMVKMVLTLPPTLDGDSLLLDMQILGEKIAGLIEQVEQTNELIKLYPAEGEKAQTLLQTKIWLMEQIELALQTHADIPAQLMALKTTMTEQTTRQYQARVNRLSNRLEEIQIATASQDEAEMRRLMSQDGEL